MQISIRQRYKPFSHKPGIKVLLPGTSSTYTIYPTKILEDSSFQPKGPVKEFTTILDLEEGEIHLFGKGQAYFEHTIKTSKEKPDFERISFGVHKKQEWDGIIERADIQEFLPLWYHLSQWYEPSSNAPSNSLIQECLESKEILSLSDHLVALFKTGFSNLFLPQNCDTNFLGYSKEPLGKEVDPIQLLSLGRDLIRSLFFKREGSRLNFLNLVPKEIHCGRFLNIREPGIKIDFEWTKNKARRLIVEVLEKKEWIFSFPKEIKQFRIKSLKPLRQTNSEPVVLEPGLYLFDQFQK